MTDTTTSKLLAHVEKICTAVLGPDTVVAISISAYVAGESMPDHIPATHEYMIVIDFSSVPELMPDALKSLSSFLGRGVFAQATHPPACLYWSEGDSLDYATSAFASNSAQVSPVANRKRSPLASVEWMKTDTILPNWLDGVLFDALGGRHEPNWQRFERNLDLNEDEVKIYLGTYFPRTYAEAFCIFDSLLANDEYSAAWSKKTEASILDLGTGTGGNLVGLLTALAKHCPRLRRVSVHGFDGNPLALEAAKTILSSFLCQAPFIVDATFREHRILSLNDLPSPERNDYDFITSFKMGGEIVSSGIGVADDFYHQFLVAYATLLSATGLLILLDVTTKPAHTHFYPQLLNEQVSRFIRTHLGFATLVPVPCHIHETRCSQTCFTQKEFAVTHRSARNDRSRVAYRVVARKACASIFHQVAVANADYIICAKPENEMFSTCKHSSSCGILVDGYRNSR
jgi:hypothetical protein